MKVSLFRPSRSPNAFEGCSFCSADLNRGQNFCVSLMGCWLKGRVSATRACSAFQLRFRVFADCVTAPARAAVYSLVLLLPRFTISALGAQLPHFFAIGCSSSSPDVALAAHAHHGSRRYNVRILPPPSKIQHSVTVIVVRRSWLTSKVPAP